MEQGLGQVGVDPANLKNKTDFARMGRRVHLLVGVVQGAAILDDELGHGGLLVHVHLGPDHELGVPLRQVALLH